MNTLSYNQHNDNVLTLTAKRKKMIWRESKATVQFGNKLEHFVISVETGLICDRDFFLD